MSDLISFRYSDFIPIEKNEQIISNFFYGMISCSIMFTQEDNEFVEKLSEWAESIGINLDRDSEQL